MACLKLLRVAFGLAGASAIFAGCGAPLQRLSPVADTPASVAQNGSSGEKSWMLPRAQKQPNLLYIANSGTSDVTVYTYLDGKGLLLVGTLTGFSSPAGMCTDSAGNVWIPDANTRRIYEYAHGGTKRIDTIQQQSGYPSACSVNPDTGDLAVVSKHPNGKYQSYTLVEVYPKGSKTGTPHSAPHGFKDVEFVAYDNASNLYADGTPCFRDNCYYDKNGPPGLYELANGRSEFQRLSFRGATLYQPTAINWVKPILLLGDRNFQNQGTSGAYKVVVAGSKATVVGTLPFDGTQQAYGFSRRAGRVIVPDYTGNVVRIYNLSNGAPYSQLNDDISSPFSAVVSQHS
jgi:hypothetical protein